MRTKIRTRAAWRRLTTIGATVLLLAGGPAVGTASAAEAADCPDAYPVADVTDGMTASGLTVEHGKTPDPFTVKVVGTLKDGIAPGMDMIIAEADSPAIQRAGGIWAGMSGSPVYTSDGRLLGAVAYGFTLAPSPVAGITPAEHMYDILERPAAAGTSTRSTVRIPAAIQAKLVRSGAATTAQAEDGMHRLTLPLAVSGLSSNRTGKAAERLEKQLPHTRVVAAGAFDGSSAPSDIFPGSNFAAALSYGDFTASGVGTTTAICGGDTALAFGHPFTFDGKSSMSVHAADAVKVVRDDTFGSFKLANTLGVVGTLDQDRLAGIRGKLGAGPATVPVLSRFDGEDGASRDGRTDVTLPEFVPNGAFFHALSNLDRVADRIGGGTADLRWLIKGTRASGAPFQLDVSNAYASEFDVSYEALFDSVDQIFAIQDNEFEDAKITEVRYAGSIASEFKRYSIQDVLLRKPNGTFAAISDEKPLRVVTGSRLNLRVVLAPHKNIGEKRNVDLSVAVPAAAAGSDGFMSVSGGRGFDESGEGDEQPANFDELLAELDGLTPNNSVNATLSLDGRSGSTTRSARETVDQVVRGNFDFPVTVVPAPRSLPAVVDGSTWKLRSSLTSGSPTKTFTFGSSSYRQVMGDFDGNGSATPAVFRDGKWTVKTSWSSTKTVTFGQAGDRPVVGDWNGDGADDIGVFRNGRWLLRNSVSSGPAELDFSYGASTARPVVGDWNGDGVDSVGVFSAGQWRLRNDNSAGNPTYSFSYGTSGDQPVVGDWNRTGRDRPGIYRGGSWFARDLLQSGSSAYRFTFGGTTSRPLTWR